jgi:hypothetical protein
VNWSNLCTSLNAVLSSTVTGVIADGVMTIVSVEIAQDAIILIRVVGVYTISGYNSNEIVSLIYLD